MPAVRRLRHPWEPAERAYFLLCLALGRLLRAARYSQARLVRRDGQLAVRKRRFFHAPLLVWMGGALVKLLDTGVRVLPQRDWQERERRIYQRLHGASVCTDTRGGVVLPRLAGRTLASLLEDPELEGSLRREAIERAVVALVEFHRLGFTHGDAMADNMMVDLDARVARWFDFETVHDARRPSEWRRADDVRALLVTCLVRTAPDERADTLHLVLDAYPDQRVSPILATYFASVWRRPLMFHLGQAGLSLPCFRQIARLLAARAGESAIARNREGTRSRSEASVDQPERRRISR